MLTASIIGLNFLTDMLLALLDNASALSILSACGADVAGLEKDVRKVLADTVPLLDDDESRDTQPTIGFQRVAFHILIVRQHAGRGHRERIIFNGWISRNTSTTCAPYGP